MNQNQITKVYAALGSLLVAITINTWLFTQGGETILGVALISKDAAGAAFIAQILCGALLILVSAVAIKHACNFGTNWSARIPVVWLDGLDTAKWDAKIFQIAILVIFFVVPVGGLAHFRECVQNAWLCDAGNRAKSEQVKVVGRQGLQNPQDQTRLVAELPTKPDLCKGIEVFPSWEFLAVTLLDGMAIVMVLAFFISVFRPSSSRAAPTSSKIGFDEETRIREHD